MMLMSSVRLFMSLALFRLFLRFLADWINKTVAPIFPSWKICKFRPLCTIETKIQSPVGRILGIVLWIVVSLKYAWILFICSGFHMHHLCNARLFIRGLCKGMLPWASPVSSVTPTWFLANKSSSRSLSLTRWEVENEYKNSRDARIGCARSSTGLNKQANCSWIQFIGLVYLDRVNKNADPTVTPCWPRTLTSAPSPH